MSKIHRNPRNEKAKVRVEIVYADGTVGRETFVVDAPNDRLAEQRGLAVARHEAMSVDEAVAFDVVSVTWPQLAYNPSMPCDRHIAIAARLARGEA